MRKWLITLGLICLGFCSCQRIVWTAKPVIENGDKSDLSLVGVWTRYKRPVVDVVAADETIEVTSHDGNSNIVYDEAGTPHCYDRASAPMVRHRMSYIGHEPSRGTLKYRCPAMHEA